MTSELHQIVYRSTFNIGRVDKTLQVLRDIVKTSQRNNRASAITGYLIFDGVTFLQILEGSRPDVEETFERISADSRHRDAEVLLSRTITQRDFSDWAMAGYLSTQRINVTATALEMLALAKSLQSSPATVT